MIILYNLFEHALDPRDRPEFKKFVKDSYQKYGSNPAMFRNEVSKKTIELKIKRGREMAFRNDKPKTRYVDVE